MIVQACQMTFSQFRLLPMGSYPRVADGCATHDLYGPVNRFVCTGYDRAQVAFLACLKVCYAITDHSSFHLHEERAGLTVDSLGQAASPAA